jgi:hypothetical protein
MNNHELLKAPVVSGISAESPLIHFLLFEITVLKRPIVIKGEIKEFIAKHL